MEAEKAKSILIDIHRLIETEEEYDEYKKVLGDILAIKMKAERYYAKVMTVEMVAFLNDQSPQTVRKYIKLGLIPLHPLSSDRKMLIRASDAIVIDFNELKKQAKP